MSSLYVDSNPLMSDEKEQELKKSREEFEAKLNTFINEAYRGSESDGLYKGLTKPQILVLQTAFKGFSKEMYRELNNTVDLQIQQKKERVKEKIRSLSEYMGEINLKDWEYDGMVDSGKDASVKCDLCPRPIRYAHFAVNKKTHECLRFGCNCAADFFDVDKGTITSMKTIQAQTLKDIKRIVCVYKEGLMKEYYTYLGGYVGEVILKSGEQGLRNLISYEVLWYADKKRLKGNEETQEYYIRYSDGKKVLKPLTWIKENIVSCINADLDDNIYSPLSQRSVVYKDAKDIGDEKVNTTIYVNMILKFMEVGLPAPLFVIKKLNGMMNKVTRQHKADYLKFAQELLISNNLEKSSLLRTAFTDFIVNYLASSIGTTERDEELAKWRIRGTKTFYNVVLNWETMIVKLGALKEVNSLIKQGYITESEWDKYFRRNRMNLISLDYTRFKKYIDDCLSLFFSNKEVIRVPENMPKYSKYMLKGVDTKIGLSEKASSRYSYDFNADVIPAIVGLQYIMVQEGYRKLVNDSLNSTLRILGNIPKITSDENVLKYLCLIRLKDSNVHFVCDKTTNYYYYGVNNFNENLIDEFYKKYELPDELFETVKEKYLSLVPALRNDTDILLGALKDLIGHLKSLQVKKLPTAASINDDYDKVLNADGNFKGSKEYFLEYCDLLTNKRGTKRIQQYMGQNNLYCLIPYKQMSDYKDLFLYIQNYAGEMQKKASEIELFKTLDIKGLKRDLEILTYSDNLDDFIRLIIYGWTRQNYRYESYYLDSEGYMLTSYMDNVSREFMWGRKSKDELLDSIFYGKLAKHVQQLMVDKCKGHSVEFKALFDSLKNLSETLSKYSNSISYSDFVELLKGPVDKTRGYINTSVSISVQDFINSLEYNDNINPRYTGSCLMNLTLSTQLFGLYNDFDENTSIAVYDLLKGYGDEYKKIEDELREKKREEDRLKNQFLEYQECLNEHIKFFEVDVDALRKADPRRNGKRSDEGLRRTVFSKVKYESSGEILPRFIRELEKNGDISGDINAYLNDAKNANTNILYKRYAEILRVELYNQKLIYNHFELTHKVLKELKDIPLTTLGTDNLETLKTILGRYYILKSDLMTVYDIICQCGNTNIDMENEVNQLPEPRHNDINTAAKEIISNYTDEPDTTGLTGVEKAKRVYEHKDFKELPDYLRNIVRSVYRYERCSQKQLIYVNKAFEELKLGNVSNESETKGSTTGASVGGVTNVSNSSSNDNSTNVQNVGATTQTDSDDENSKNVELAKTIKEHPDFSTLPTFMRGIVRDTIRSGVCTPNRLKYILKAKEALKI